MPKTAPRPPYGLAPPVTTAAMASSNVTAIDASAPDATHMGNNRFAAFFATRSRMLSRLIRGVAANRVRV